MNSGVSIGEFRSTEAAAWDDYASAHPDGTIYHTTTWKSVTEDGFGHRAYYLRATDASGRIIGLLPLFLVTGLFGRRLVSVPMRDRAGILADNEDVASALLHRAIALTKELRCKYLELKCLRPMTSELVAEGGLHREQGWITSQIDLTVGRDALWKGLNKDSVRWAIKKAGRIGVHAEFCKSESDLDTFYELFSRTRREMGIPSFSKSFFGAIWHHVIQKEKGNLLLVYNQDEPIHGMISFFSGRSFIPAYAAPQNAWRKQYPSEVAIWRSIEWAVDNGFTQYDFGADSVEQEGLLWFKSKWGAVQHPMSYYYYVRDGNAVPNFDSSSSGFRIVRNVWSKLPLSVAKPLGAIVTRQLS